MKISYKLNLSRVNTNYIREKAGRYRRAGAFRPYNLGDRKFEDLLNNCKSIVRKRFCQNLYAGSVWAHRSNAHRSPVVRVIDSQRRGGAHVLVMSDVMK